MADVGVLNLQIKANASQAAQSLRSLASALSRVKDAIGKGLTLGSTGTTLKRLKELLGGDWSGSDQFKIAMGNLRDGANMLSKSGTAAKLEGAAKAMKTISDAYQKYIQSFAQSNNEASKATATVKEAVGDWRGKMAGANSKGTNLQFFASSPKGEKMNAMNWANGAVEAMHKVNEAAGGVDAGTVNNITNLTNALNGLKGVSGIGGQLKTLAEGLTAILRFDGDHKGSSGTIERIGTSLKHFKEKTSGFKSPNFSGIIKLTDALQRGFFASVEIENIAKALEHLSKVGESFTMPNLSGLKKLTSAISGTQTADAKATSSMKKVSDVVDEAAGKMQTVAPGVEANVGTAAEEAAQKVEQISDAANHVAAGMKNVESGIESVGKRVEIVAQRIADQMSNILPDNMSWNVGEKMVSVDGKMQTSVDDVKAVADAVESGYSRMEKITDNGPVHMEFVKVDPDADEQRIREGTERVAATAQRRLDKLREMFKNSSPVRQEDIAKDFGMTREQMFPDPVEAQASAQGLKTVTEAMENYISVEAEMPKTDISAPGSMSSTLMDIMNQPTSPAFDNLKESEQQTSQQTEQLTGDLKDLDREMKQKKPDAEQAASAMDRFKASMKDLGSGVKTLFKPLTNLAKQFWRIAKRMAIRAIIKQVTSAFREGTENVYRYSEAIGSSFSSEMDSAATSLNQMKNSIGAAVAPAIQMLLPILQSVVSWLTTAINYVNQFLSLLSGKSTWTRALPVATKAFDEQKKAAKSASDTVKDMLADFDELNIIQQNGNGGSGSGSSDTATDYTTMFEEVSEFDSKIKDMVQWIEDHMDSIKTMAIAIGTAILGWKISSAFNGVLGTLGSIIAGGALVVLGLEIGKISGYDVGLNGANATNVTASIVGAVATAIGGYLIAGWGGLAVGLTVYTGIWLEEYFAGKKKAAYIATFGSIVLDADQMKKWVQSMFVFPIDVYIELMNTSIANYQEAKEALKVKINAFNMSLNKIRLRVDTSNEALDQLLTDANNTLTAFKEKNQAALQMITVGVQLGTLTDGNNQPLHITSLDQIGMDLTGLEEAANYAGKQLSYWVSQGMSDGLDETTQAMIAKYSSYLMRITSAGQTGQIEGQFETTMAIAVGDLSHGSLMEGIKKMTTAVDDYANAINELNINNATQFSEMAASFREVERMYTEEANAAQDQATAEHFREEAEKARLKAVQYEEEAQKIRENLNVSKQNARLKALERVQEEFRKIFKDDVNLFQGGQGQLENVENMWSKSYGDFGSFEDRFKEYINGNNTWDLTASQIGGLLSSNVYSVLGKLDKETEKIVQGLGLSGWEILPKSARKQLYQYIKDASPSTLAATEFMRDAFNVDISQMIEISGWENLSEDAKARYMRIWEEVFGEDSLKAALKQTDFGQNAEVFANFIGENFGNMGLEPRAYLLRRMTDMFGEDSVRELLNSRYSSDIADQYMNEMQIIRSIVEYGVNESDLRAQYADIISQYEYIITELQNRLDQNGNTRGANYDPTRLRASAMPGMPLGTAPIRSRTSVDIEGPEYETDTRTAEATEATSQSMTDQNTKIDVLTGLLRAVLARLNAGLNVNMGQTSTAGRVVGGALAAFARVTGDN